VPLGGSLMRSLYTEACLRLRDPLLTHKSQLRDRNWAAATQESQDSLRHGFAALAAQLGFSPVPFLDGDQIFFNRSDASLALYAQLGANVLYVRAANKGAMEKLGKVFSDNLGLTVWA